MNNTLAVHFDGDEYTEDDLQEIKDFILFAQSHKK